MSVYIECLVGRISRLPLGSFGPCQSPEATQDSTSIPSHTSVVIPPGAIVLGTAPKISDGIVPEDGGGGVVGGGGVPIPLPQVPQQQPFPGTRPCWTK
jgi:hypothetical protein